MIHILINKIPILIIKGQYISKMSMSSEMITMKSFNENDQLQIDKMLELESLFHHRYLTKELLN